MSGWRGNTGGVDGISSDVSNVTVDRGLITEGRIRVELDTNIQTANFVVLHNADPTDGTGASITCRTDTTGAGADDREMGHIRWEITTHDDATRTADLVIGLADNGSGAVERLRIKSDGKLAASDTSDIEIDLIEGHLLYQGVEIIDWAHGAIKDFNGNLLISLEDAGNCVTSLSDIGMATKAYADALVVGLIDDRGNYDASVNTFPASGGSGTAGAILKGDLWTISVAGTLGGTAVTAGDAIRALVDSPGQTASNWAVTENNFGFTPESSANKSTDTALGSSNTLYPTQGAVKSYVDTGLATKQNSLGFTPLNPANNLSELTNAATAKTNLQTWIHVAATADQSVTSNAGLTNSTYLTFTIPTGKRYAFKCLVFFNTPAAADFRYDLNASGVPTVFRVYKHAVGNGNTAFAGIGVDTAGAVLNTIAGNGTDGGLVMEGYLYNNTGSSMTLTFRFGQNVSTASPTTLLTGSFLEYLDITT